MKYIKELKQTLEQPELILKEQDEPIIIFSKKINDKEYFTSINLETQDYFITISNAPKKANILKNKIKNGAKIIYQSPNSESITYTPELLQTSQSSANRIDLNTLTNQSLKELKPIRQQYAQTSKRKLQEALLEAKKQDDKKLIQFYENELKDFDTKYAELVKKNDESLKNLRTYLKGTFFDNLEKKKITQDYDKNRLNLWNCEVYESYLKQMLTNDYTGFGHLAEDFIEESIEHLKSGKLNRDDLLREYFIVKEYEILRDTPAQEADKAVKSFIESEIKRAKEYHEALKKHDPTLYSNPHLGSGLAGGSLAGLERDEEGNISFNPEKFLSGFIAGSAGSLAVLKGFKYARELKTQAKINNKDLYNIFENIDKSTQAGSKMFILGKENLSPEVLTYIIVKNKKIAINKLNEEIAKELNFKYPKDVRRTIDFQDLKHILRRHGENSILVKKTGQKPISLNEIMHYQDLADSAEIKKLSKSRSNQDVLISIKAQDENNYIVIEQIKRKHNELALKTMYHYSGELTKEAIERLTSQK